jgi:4-amino-4-deoxy-L-arabinose transferase-like glycosyltransferase
MLVVAYRRGEWALPPYAVVDSGAAETPRLRPGLLLLSLPLILAAFLSLSHNRFTTLNVTLWLLAILTFCLAFWQKETSAQDLRQRLSVFFGKFHWQVVLSPWTVLILAAVALVIFFRVYRIGQVPPEMVSDQAEKLLDIWDVLHGQTSIFFPRNTGREAIQMYLTAGIIQLLGTGYSYISLKIGTVLAGLLTLPFIYLLGKEIGGRRLGLLAMVLAGIAYWPNVISRVGLRFPLYPLFVAPTLYYLVRGLRRKRFNDFILAGLWLGVGMHGYTPIRIMPFVVVIGVGLFLLHPQSKGWRKQAFWGLVVLGLVALVVFLPLMRYALENPDMFSYRSFTRLGSVEQPLPGPAGVIFLQNLWRAVTMFAWDDGEIWVHSVTHRPALDVISAAFFYLGVLLVSLRYLRQRNWLDIFLILSVPLLMMPSILSLAFPAENPALNRMGGAIIPVFLIVGLALDSWMESLNENISGRWGRRVAWGAALLLVVLSAAQNYNLVFRQYTDYYKEASWNTSEMGEVFRDFAGSVGSLDSAYVVAYPYWVDTRLVGINAGYPTKDYAIQPDQLKDTLAERRAKLFLVNREDQSSLSALQQLYPDGAAQLYPSFDEGHSFWIFFVPQEP